MANPRWWHDDHETAWSRVKAELDSDDEAAVRYGTGARQHYGTAYPDWDDRVESKMRQEWQDLKSGRTWDEVKGAVRRGWDRVRK